MGVRIRMIGELNLLPHDLQEIIAKVMENSQRNDK
jgi:undecaprenyl pyrophosphate synthase